MLRKKDLNQNRKIKRIKAKAPRISAAGPSTSKENKPPAYSPLKEASAQKLLHLLLASPVKTEKSVKSLFGVKDIQNIFVDRSDFDFQKKPTLSNLEKTPSLRPSLLRNERAKKPKSKPTKMKFKTAGKTGFMEFRVFGERERFSGKSSRFLRKRVSQEFDNDMETDEEMARREVSIERNLLLKAVKRHSL